MSSWHALHFNKIAKMLRDLRRKYPPFMWNDKAKTELLDELTLEFAKYFKEQNENFNVDKFIVASGYTKEIHA